MRINAPIIYFEKEPKISLFELFFLFIVKTTQKKEEIDKFEYNSSEISSILKVIIQIFKNLI
jgi:hypothetical protein